MVEVRFETLPVVADKFVLVILPPFAFVKPSKAAKALVEVTEPRLVAPLTDKLVEVALVRVVLPSTT